MKNPKMKLLIVLTFLLSAFLAAFFVFRNERRPPVQISAIHYSKSSAPFVKPFSESSLVNINTAEIESLTTLPGIGTTLAQRIIDYRIAHGNYQSEAELLNIEGISSGTLDAILHLITTGGK